VILQSSTISACPGSLSFRERRFIGATERMERVHSLSRLVVGVLLRSDGIILDTQCAGLWPHAAVALHYMNGFEQRFREAVETSEKVIAALRADGNFEVQRIATARTSSASAPPVSTRRCTASALRKPA
jgi:hypothetical protein